MRHTDYSINEVLEQIAARHPWMAESVAAMENEERWTRWSEPLTTWARGEGTAAQLRHRAVQIGVLPFAPVRLTLAAAVASREEPESIQVRQRRDWLVRHGVIERLCHEANVADTIKTIRNRGS